MEIQGNVAYEDGELRDLLRTRGSSFWKPWKKNPLRSDFIRADRQTLGSFYRRHGYLYARVDSVTVLPVGDSKKSDVHFHLTEGPRAAIDTFLVTDTGPLAEREVRSRLMFQEGSPLDFAVLEASRDSVVNEYADRGYVLARIVDSLSIDSTRVSVFYRVFPGPRVLLGGVKVEGTQKTKPGYVTRELVLDDGDLLRRSKLVHSQQRIYDSGLYTDVQMELAPVDSATSKSDLFIRVRERKMGWVDAGIGYGNIDQIRLTGQWGQRNIFRSSLRFVATGKLGIRLEKSEESGYLGDRRVDASLTHPWPFGVRLSTTVGVYAENEPVVDENDWPLQAYGGSLLFASSFLRTVRASASYELRHVTNDSLLAPSPGAAAVQDTSYTTHRIAFTGQRDTRLNIFDPKDGSDVNGRLEFVRAAEGGTFTKIGLQGTRYMPMPTGGMLALRLRGGFIEPRGSQASSDPFLDVPPELARIPVDDRYRTGGASTVRGYFENELGTREVATTDTLDAADATDRVARGGQVLLLVSAELRFSLPWIFQGAFFFDGGNTWERPEDMKLRKILSFGGGAGYNDMRYSAGAGLRIGTPVGPIRADYGWKLRSARLPLEPDLSSPQGEFHFSLGHPY
ncbi:MAG TPA: BamA/TamA family outer membrane protein [Candidatus Eisenbacteria bacterium]|nr:BamA/TamA family outer membrane protein [Candidatus Eisenbacteria bacterium]